MVSVLMKVGVMIITLSIAADGAVMASYSGSGSERIEQLFGTLTLPAAYTFDRIPVADVDRHMARIYSSIRSANPSDTVVWSNDALRYIIACSKASRSSLHAS
jgi:hypothetical protein